MEGIDIVASTMSGAELIKCISCGCADVIVTELTLMGVDGIAVLETMQAMRGAVPKAIVVSNMNSDWIVNTAVGLGASYYMIKPVDIALVYSRIRMLTRDVWEELPETDSDVRKSTGEILRRMGISPSMKGYHCLEEAVVLRNEDDTRYRHLTRQLYPKIAERGGVSPECVERAIRTAIASAWDKGALRRFAAETEDAMLLRVKPTAGNMIEKLSVLTKRYASGLN